MKVENFTNATISGERSIGPVSMYFASDSAHSKTFAPAEPVQRVLFRLADAICSLVAFLLAYAILPAVKNAAVAVVERFSVLTRILSPATNGPDMPSIADLWWVFVVVTLAMALTLDYMGEAKPLVADSTWRIARRLLLAAIVALSAIATVFFALRVPPYSRIFLCSYVTILLTLSAGYRQIAKIIEARRHASGLTTQRVVLAGTAEGIDRFANVMANAPSSHAMAIVGCVLIGESSMPHSAAVEHLGHIGDLGDLLIHNPIDQVIVVLPDGESAWLTEVIEHCDYFRVGVEIIHQCFLDLQLRDLRHSNQRCPVPSIRLIPEEELATPMLLWKRGLDIVLSFLALLALAPLMAAIAAAIKMSTPHLDVFYRWNVVGYRGRRFTGYKFTTMVADADDRKAELSEQNEMSGPVFKIRNDPRVTRLGKFLRKYSLNEIPQFWSVLIGDMSLVGPRPAGPHELVRYELWQKRKLSVQPGITCFWQVRGRNAITSFDDWVRMDLEYIQKRSLWTDMTILLRTVTTVLRGTGC
jgi:exopolysaccharide biosynthesis polyprenyl glycosylphosphotransferase